MSSYRLIAAVHTPFDAQGEFHSVAVERQAELLLEQNVVGVFPGGTTGESLSLSLDERLALGKQWVDVASGTDLEVILHVGANALPDAVILAEQAAQIGASGIAAMPPTYFRPDGIDMILADLKRLSAAAPELPIYYYDIPSMTGVAVDTVELVERATAEIPNFGGIKFSRPDLPVLQRVLNSPQFSGDVFFGSDEMFLSAWMFGVRGAVGSTYNFMTPVYHKMLDAFEAGDLEQARHLQLQSAKLVAALLPYGFLSASKLLMRYLGADCGQVRSPLRALSEERSQELFGVLEPFAELFPRKLEYVSEDAVTV